MFKSTVDGGLHFKETKDTSSIPEDGEDFVVASRPSASSKDTPSQPANIMTVPEIAQPFGLLDLPDELWSRIGKMVIEDLPNHHGPGPLKEEYNSADQKAEKE
ncbi:unnamed protein product [Zymoseptoria tritici ST99CH_1E4]|uniref:Uncharacterized protein n=1 Tax=Zymoseptoria tritici ST99CH_1E4 TaxID=1276532 RepID=A0A2H1GCR1_ZYMTR|nr:unnamed protein product [Zymoseptoria tritici ST99CH_1E4]